LDEVGLVLRLKEAVLPAEKREIAQFLNKSGLRFEENAGRTLYFEDGGKISATVSASGCVIKMLAVDPVFRNENLAAALLSEIIKRLHADGIYRYRVFTKPEYAGMFETLGFRPLVSTEKTAALEGGEGGIDSVLEDLRGKIRSGLGIDCRNADMGCVVINGNPFTNGHLRLAEYAAQRHEYTLVFIVEEEESYFSFKERYAMACLALQRYGNILVLPSTDYIVSKATFPGYFLKSADEINAEYAKSDALIFQRYFMAGLNIRMRYVGSETSDYMVVYNNALKDVLKDRLCVVPRFEEDGVVISASRVRKMIAEGKTEESLKYVPATNYAVFKAAVRAKLQ